MSSVDEPELPPCSVKGVVLDITSNEGLRSAGYGFFEEARPTAADDSKGSDCRASAGYIPDGLTHQGGYPPQELFGCKRLLPFCDDSYTVTRMPRLRDERLQHAQAQRTGKASVCTVWVHIHARVERNHCNFPLDEPRGKPPDTVAFGQFPQRLVQQWVKAHNGIVSLALRLGHGILSHVQAYENRPNMRTPRLELESRYIAIDCYFPGKFTLEPFQKLSQGYAHGRWS